MPAFRLQNSEVRINVDFFEVGSWSETSTPDLKQSDLVLADGFSLFPAGEVP
jgi:hypothetical protein